MPTNTQTVSYRDTNATATNLYRDHLGGTNENMDRYWGAGVNLFDWGIWDDTNKVMALRDRVTGNNAISVSNVNETVTLAGNVILNSNLYLPASTATSGNIYSGGNQIIAAPGTGNFFAGVGSGNFTLSGNDNVGLGASSLTSLTSGGGNYAGGFSALTALASGNVNTAVGNASLYNDIAGGDNSAFGGSALYLTTGMRNIGIGFQAGYNLTTGNYNIDIGNQGVAGEADIIRLGTPGIQTDTYLSGTIHSASVQISDSGPTLLTATNTSVPGDTSFDLQGQGGLYWDNIIFRTGGGIAWQWRGGTNEMWLADTNGQRAVSVTNVTDSVGLHGNVNMDSNLTVKGVITGNGSGLTNMSASGLTNGTLLNGLLDPSVMTNNDANNRTFAGNLGVVGQVTFSNPVFTRTNTAVFVIADLLPGSGYVSEAFYFGPLIHAWTSTWTSNTWQLLDANSQAVIITTNISDDVVFGGNLWGKSNAVFKGVAAATNGFASGQGATNAVLSLTSTNWNNTNGVDGYIYIAYGFTNGYMLDAQSNAVWTTVSSITNVMLTALPMRSGWTFTNTKATYNFHQ